MPELYLAASSVCGHHMVGRPRPTWAAGVLQHVPGVQGQNLCWNRQQRYHEELVPLLRRPERRARFDAEFLWCEHPQGPPGHNSGREEGDAGCSELRALGQARRGKVRETVLRNAIGALLTYHATSGVMCTALHL